MHPVKNEALAFKVYSYKSYMAKTATRNNNTKKTKTLKELMSNR